ncbi:lysine--tRNA ligase [Magnetospira sp. QH-2]|uniref:lysine--tRNA ligase n=1 Tax=Magnetospira sp. (strain QH-2) TaxID=1288970 RepID=UPI0003E80C84|nr:lysine--tRNA ligase [Magnetospira sp. QH-2]CCQ72095.1 lysyl-tRNA synthetase (Lysine-tRNA ligase) [Magnetospira sp. QH-2]
MTDDIRELAQKSNAWPFAEARQLAKRIGGSVPDKGYVLFETGYGPSGLPHIGTFGEVARTTMVRQAFEALTGLPTKLIAFSDDMDGLRKVPDNLPNKELLEPYLGKPLTQVPDPFGTHESFGHHNNARLRAFLDHFGFTYEFKSSTTAYQAGEFDETLLKMLANYDAVMKVILPTLGEERRATYSPFLPVCPRTGVVLQVPMLERDPEAGTIVYADPETGEKVETPVTGGHCKLQWKPDWAMRWAALQVDYEMSGKDLIDSVKLSSKICRILGGKPPEGFTYELFLDDRGEKISKSKGNGLAVEEWLAYAPPESLSLFMFQKPKTAKRLFFDVIPKNVDEYLTFVERFANLAPNKQIDNPAWHIHGGNPPHEEAHLSYNILLNLASVCHSEDPAVLWHYIARYAPSATPETAPMLNKLVSYAINYYRDFIKPNKQYRPATEAEKTALSELAGLLEQLPADAPAEDLQGQVYEVGKAHPDTFADLKSWFKALYQILLGQDQGPRMGSFIALYGKDETVALINRAVAGEDLGGA